MKLSATDLGRIKRIVDKVNKYNTGNCIECSYKEGYYALLKLLNEGETR